MDTFGELRKRARQIRDKIIAEARTEYASRLTRIATLERELWAGRVSKTRRLTHAVDRVMPQDRAFTTEDIYAGLEALDDRRSFKKSWVISYLAKLCDRGIIRRVQKNHGRTHAIYARVGVHVEPVPFAELTLPLAVEGILREHGKPLANVEIAVRLRERGFRSVMNLAGLRATVGACCRARPVKFKRTGDKWALVAWSA